MKIENVDKVIATLKMKAAQYGGGKRVTVAVGFQTAYALFVHENLEMKWRGRPRKPPAKGEYWGPHGQSKFLEQPAREGQATIASIFRQALQAGMAVGDSLLMAGLWLQRQAQLLVPIDTGTLKNSAFTTREDV